MLTFLFINIDYIFKKTCQIGAIGRELSLPQNDRVTYKSTCAKCAGSSEFLKLVILRSSRHAALSPRTCRRICQHRLDYSHDRRARSKGVLIYCQNHALPRGRASGFGDYNPLPIRSQRIFLSQLLCSESQLIQMNMAFPIKSFSGTNPQSRLSSLLSRLSPIIKYFPLGTTKL